MTGKRMDADIRQKVFKRDGYTCRYCGTTDGPFHADHVYPYVKGGETSINNLVTACSLCNVKKGSKVGIFPMPIGYFEPKPKRMNILLMWGFADFILAFGALLNGSIAFGWTALAVGVLVSIMGYIYSGYSYEEISEEDCETE